MDRNNPDTIYVGWTSEDIYRSFDGGANWTFFSLGTQNSNIQSISVADNSSTIYACSGNTVYESTDTGNTWTVIFTNPHGSQFTSVKAIPNEANKCVITRGGFDDDTKVWIYDDGDIEEVDANIFNTDLPEVPVNTSAISSTNPDILYVGTDIGVFYTDLSGADDWEMFNRNLPNVPVTDIQIYEAEGFMRIATFGRGIWESGLYDDCEYELNLTQANDPDDNEPGFQFNEAADQIISTRLIIGNNGDVTYKARNLILLKPGFRAKNENKVVIGIKPCGVSLE